VLLHASQEPEKEKKKDNGNYGIDDRVHVSSSKIFRQQIGQQTGNAPQKNNQGHREPETR
jgi:hypothetical protein